MRKSVERYFARLGVLVELMPKFTRKPDNSDGNKVDLDYSITITIIM